MWNTSHKPELQGQLSVHDFQEQDSVLVLLTDGAGMCGFKDAFWREEGMFIVVYTEHSGYHVFLKATVEKVAGRERD